MEYRDMDGAFEAFWGKGDVMRGTGGDWLYRCATSNYMWCRDQADIFRELWEGADSMSGFLEAVEADGRLRLRSQAWGEMAKVMGWDLPLSPDVEVHEVYADAGDLKVGDWKGTCAFRIPNGYGDGPVRLVVCERGQVNVDWFGPLAASVEGTLRIYGYDCDELSPAEPGDLGLMGHYLVYARDGVVAFVRM